MESFFKNSILFLIIFSLLNLSLKIAVIQFEYTFKNKAFIEKYCENKNKPELKCNGKCHLKKSMTSTDSQSEIFQYSILDLIPINLSHYIASNDIIHVIRKEKIYSTNKLRPNLFQIFIDHPPQNLI
ncbi:hypothetical protein [Flavobacterium okayamense]|uniref:Uncharacterized protein n=1 Tax=Flavobacterium okayamense TaxID=2830782 RepID=A0ABN6HRR8_9FLAO|nr:hypothetical protein [Flavobacterium okayamense]BCY27172.1 hypothetical protein KK2020170_00400 [Flavobacterium okayamense]